MKSSYNSFLDNIEVNEKELQRDLQRRKNAEQKRRLNKENESHYIKPQKKPNLNTNNANKVNSSSPNSSGATNKTSANRSATKEQTGNIKNRDVNNTSRQKTSQQTKQASVGTRNNVAVSRDAGVRKEKNNNTPNAKQSTKQQQGKPVVKIENAKGNVRKVTQLNTNNNVNQEIKRPINRENDRANTSNSSEQTNTVKHRRHITKERLRNEKIHIRQRKVNRDVITDDSALVEKQTFTISKEEYDEKILGTIKDNQTKMIFLKENQKLAKVPKSVVFLGMYAFVLSAVILYSFSRIGTVKVELKELNKQFNELNEVNAQLNIKLATAYNIDNIRQRAENELYMNKPEAHQIMYITVVPENNVEYEMGTNDE